jgi:hypothetical protein
MQLTTQAHLLREKKKCTEWQKQTKHLLTIVSNQAAA